MANELKQMDECGKEGLLLDRVHTRESKERMILEQVQKLGEFNDILIDILYGILC